MPWRVVAHHLQSRKRKRQQNLRSKVKNGQLMLENYFSLENVDQLSQTPLIQSQSQPRGTGAPGHVKWRHYAVSCMNVWRHCFKKTMAFNYKRINVYSRHTKFHINRLTQTYFTAILYVLSDHPSYSVFWFFLSWKKNEKFQFNSFDIFLFVQNIDCGHMIERILTIFVFRSIGNLVL